MAAWISCVKGMTDFGRDDGGSKSLGQSCQWFGMGAMDGEGRKCLGVEG